SQEVIQEFQVSVNNADPSTGISSSGTVNLVTRRGGNQLHGSFDGFFRDSQYAAFPSLGHRASTPNPNNDPRIAAFNEAQAHPPFWRRKFGGILSGPLRKDRLFWLASLEVTRQLAADIWDPNFAEFGSFLNSYNYPKTRF